MTRVRQIHLTLMRGWHQVQSLQHTLALLIQLLHCIDSGHHNEVLELFMVNKVYWIVNQDMINSVGMARIQHFYDYLYSHLR